MSKDASHRYILTVSVVAAVVVGVFLYHLGYSRGLQAGLEWAKGNTESALIRDLGTLRSMRNEESRLAVWGVFSAELEELSNTERLSRSADTGVFENLISLLRGDGTIYSMSDFVSPTDERIGRVQDVCRKVAAEQEYTKYCAGLHIEHKRE